MAGVKGKSGGDRRSTKAKGIDLPRLPALPETKAGYDRLIAALNADPITDEQTKDSETAGWRSLWDSPHDTIRLNVRKFLYTMRDGNPRDTVNHLHDKPLELTGNVTFSIAETLREARERAGKK